jgi:hypothetical protein
MQVVTRTPFAPGFAGHIDREAKILSGSRAIRSAREAQQKSHSVCPKEIFRRAEKHSRRLAAW